MKGQMGAGQGESRVSSSSGDPAPRTPQSMINRTIYENLKGVAAAERFISYGDAGSLVGLDMGDPPSRAEIAQILDQINIYESRQGRPMLSAIVVRLHDQVPGGGFFECARDLGRLNATDKLLEMEFWVKEVRKVFGYWARAKKP